MNNKEELGSSGVIIMSGVDTNQSDFSDLKHIASCFARMGCDVKILCPVHYKSPMYVEVFQGLINTKYHGKCPDLMIDGNYYEYESYVRPWNKRKMSNMISKGLKQSDRIIIDNREGTSYRQILRSIRARLNVNAKITEVWIYDGDGVVDIFP